MVVYNPIVIDIFAAAVLAVFVIMGIRRGLLRSLLDVVILALALLGAAWLSSRLMGPVSHWLEPMVEERVLEKSPLAGLNLQLPDALSGLSGLLGNLRQVGREYIVDTVLEMIQPIVNAAIYVIVFVLLVVLLKVFSKLLHIVEKLPVIHSCNKLGGALFGLLSGVTVLALALWAAEQFKWLPAETLQNTYAAKYFVLSTWMHNAI